MAGAMSVLAACASRPPQGAADEDAAKDGAATDATGVGVRIDAPRPLRNLLMSQLDVARLKLLAAGRPLSEAEIDRLIALVPQQTHELLATEGYFSPIVSVQRESMNPPTIRVVVDPGPRTVVSGVDLQLKGDIEQAAAQGQRHAIRSRQKMVQDFALKPGEPWRNEDWQSAKTKALTELWGFGYREADWQETRADVDMGGHAAALHLTARSGRLYRTGPLRVQGLVHQDEQTVRNLADFPEGTPATEKLLLDYQERLQASGLFDRATVTIPRQVDDPARAPVDVQLTERKLQEFTLGAGVNSDVGVRGTLEHTDRRAFGRAWTARNDLEISGVRQKWDGEVRTHALPGLWQDLIGGTAERIHSPSDVQSSARVRAGRSMDTQRLDRLYFVEVEHSVDKSASSRDAEDAISANAHTIWRRVDNLRLPTRGEVYSLQLGVGQSKSDPGGTGPFFRAYGRAVAYRPLGADWHGQGRLELGEVFSADDVTAPASMRFRAGGQDSVRGYDYRSLAPMVNGLVTGGKVLFTSSVELAHPLLKRYPDLWGAVFVDAGRAANRWGDLSPAVGFGVGVRYRSPVGPVSVDLAYGEEVHQFRVHVNVGVNF